MRKATKKPSKAAVLHAAYYDSVVPYSLACFEVDWWKEKIKTAEANLVSLFDPLTGDDLTHENARSKLDEALAKLVAAEADLSVKRENTKQKFRAWQASVLPPEECFEGFFR